MAFIRDNNINYWPTPGESPDLNPIEMLWKELKHFLSTVVKPRNKEELVDGIHTFWSARVTPEKCQRYIGHLQKVLPGDQAGGKSIRALIQSSYKNPNGPF